MKGILNGKCVSYCTLSFFCALYRREFYPPERERESPYLEPIYRNMLDNIAYPPLLAPTLELVKYCSNHQHSHATTEQLKSTT